MAIYNPTHDIEQIIRAARQWVETCLVNDGSVFSDTELWTVENLKALDRWFIQRPDVGGGSFYEKLEGQLADAPAQARQLMADVLWIVFLFPSKTSAGTKRDAICRVWGWSGNELDSDHALLDDAVLRGIGSGGPGFNLYRWRELIFVINIALSCKSLAEPDRRLILSDYDRFVTWLESVPEDGKRQFRHILRYFLFTDRVERMASNTDRRKVLTGFKRGDKRQIRRLNDAELDTGLFKLRKELEEEYGTPELDFYAPPLRDIWKSANEGDENLDEEAEDSPSTSVADGDSKYDAAKPRNLILYGPPGTGKTYRLQQLFSEYTDQPADVERASWEQELVSGYGWRPVIAAALEAIGNPVRVQQIVEHPLVRAKAKQRDRKGDIRPQMWSYLQEHTPPWVETVQAKNRREPLIFTKNQESEWSLVDDWRDRDGDALELAEEWSRGPGGNAEPVRRYRVVTFHPSYSYEDFMIGLKPVEAEDADGDVGGTTFRMVSGVFKQLCALAKANPTKRYALFIDEINRANIAKVFGELIMLIESDKRARYDESGKLLAGMEVQLPGMEGEEGRFGVPENLDIYGTMNTADRSIALLDVALRRRFEFEEMPPDYRLINRLVEGVDLAELLRTINVRLECLLDRDHRIGHAYLIKARTLDDLRSTFARQIIPLLQEYFFDDWSRVLLILSDGKGHSSFVDSADLNPSTLFGTMAGEINGAKRYTVTPRETWSAEGFASIYKREAATPETA